ncbi:MAG: cell division protein FtsA [Candidatus Spechtbacteria bacterium RIFCSPLOWO2_01_FULL_43_12]|uniref:Cell division protein FtsA n=1 Tax=Candidatus Spechtbacteria bacterium RIFCSPLOWO2_01_FULL_43_12 TaxID=1802162 RepID=A0A1G2HFT8_9BACT|nr:MAG: cell division protein FtsA [Candidatus Spechtbacteria bacterium RIFCSPLOWO2_01_FULL_43_12]
MAREHIITGIDIGSRYIYTVITAFNPDAPVPKVIGVGKVASEGIRKGLVTNISEAASAVLRSVEEAERYAGVSASRAFVSVGGSHIVSQQSRGTIAVSRADGEISENDVARVIEEASAVAFPANREILHNIPSEFIVDGQGGLRDRDVVGMNGIRLEANTLMIGGSTPHLRNLERVLSENNIDYQGFVLSPLAASKSVLSRQQKEVGVLCLDMGAGTTNLAVHENGQLIYANVLPIGGDNITNDLAIGLRVQIETAEILKREFGMATSGEISKGETIDLSQLNPNEEGKVSRKDVVTIMEARLNEIFDMVNKELRGIGREAYLPGGVVLVGGCTKIPRIVDLCRQKLRLPTQIGFPRDVEGVVASMDDPSYATVIGLVFWGIEESGYKTGGGGKGISMPSSGIAKSMLSKLGKLTRSLLP